LIPLLILVTWEKFRMIWIWWLSIKLIRLVSFAVTMCKCTHMHCLAIMYSTRKVAIQSFSWTFWRSLCAGYSYFKNHLQRSMLIIWLVKFWPVILFHFVPCKSGHMHSNCSNRNIGFYIYMWILTNANRICDLEKHFRVQVLNYSNCLK